MSNLPRFSDDKYPSVEASALGLSTADIRRIILYAANLKYVSGTQGKGLSGVELIAFTALYEDAYSSPHKQEKHRIRQFPGKTPRAITDAFTRLANKGVPVESRRVLDDEVDPMEPFTQYFFSRASKSAMAQEAAQYYELSEQPLDWDVNDDPFAGTPERATVVMTSTVQPK